MQTSISSHSLRPHPVRRGFLRSAKLAASTGLALFALQLAIGSAGLYVQARSREFGETWPDLLMFTVGAALLYRAASAFAYHLLGRSPRWAWPFVRSRIASAVRRPAAA